MTAGHGEASTPGHSAASLEERAMLEALRARADRTGQEAAQTLAELAGRLAQVRDPQAISRALAAQARRGRAVAVRAARDKLTGSRGAKRVALAAIPALGMLTASIVARRRGWLWHRPPRRYGWLSPSPPRRGGRGSCRRHSPGRRAGRA